MSSIAHVLTSEAFLADDQLATDEMGSEYVEGVNAISAERASPHPHVFSDRMMRPGDPVFYDILHSYMGYRTCYYRCFSIGSATQGMVDAYKRCRDYLDASIELIRPGRSTAEVASVWPKATEFGLALAAAISCLTLVYGALALAAITTGTRPIRATGSRSFSASKGAGLYSAMLAASALAAISSV